MAIKTVESTDPRVHSRNIQNALDELIEHSRQDIPRVDEPKFQTLLETTAEVLIGLKTAFQHYNEGRERPWTRYET